MRTAILVVWWIGLVGALVPTLVILKQAALVIGTLRDILRLATLTRTAAQGIERNVAAVQALSVVESAVQPLPEALGAVTAPVRSLAQRLRGVVEG
jgi:hypothetical protein